MVFRKPYAFLIKHFKIVHLILTLIYIYLALKVNGILKYYNNFISGTESKLNAINYVNNFYIPSHSSFYNNLLNNLCFDALQKET